MPRRPVAVLTAAAAVALALTACGTVVGGTGSPATTPSTVAATGQPASTSPSAAAASTTTIRSAEAMSNASDLDAEASLKAAVAAQPSGSVSVAALDVSTGATYSAGATSGMWTASAYKLFVLETLLLKEQSEGGLTDDQQAMAADMIEQSDNEDGYELFEEAGGRSALVAAAVEFGLTSTVPGDTDPTFTTTSGADYLTLLRNLVSAASPLSAASRAYILVLMTDVESDQRWGVGVVADPGTTFANKNGWLSIDDDNGPGEDDGGLWAVTSVGVVTVGGHQLLMAVFTQHQESMTDGVSLVESLSRLLASAVN